MQAPNGPPLQAGDFWHARGSLPVEPLNAVLRVLRTWTSPTLMLVGNHDQVRHCFQLTACAIVPFSSVANARAAAATLPFQSLRAI